MFHKVQGYNNSNFATVTKLYLNPHINILVHNHHYILYNTTGIKWVDVYTYIDFCILLVEFTLYLRTYVVEYSK